MSGSLNCISGQYVKGYAGPQQQHCSRISADGLLLSGCRFGALSSGCERYIKQWAGYTYTWWRDRDLVHPVRRERGEEYDQDLRDSPFLYLLNAAGTRDLPLRLRRRLAGGGAQGDFPILEELAIAGATDYFAELIPVGMVTEAFPDNGIGFSFATDHPDGFGNDDLQLIEAVLPAVSLAIMSDAEHTISAGLLAAYLGSDVGRRVHAGVVERGSVESIQAVLWYADIRGFTPIADATPGPVLVEMLDDIFETLTAALRPHGGEVLKFLGDGMLASFAFAAATRDETCSHALAAATEAMRGLDRLNADRARMGKPIATVDLALHLGEVLYGNVGAMDRLDFTVIGPAVNEVARIETLCEPLGHRVLVSAELASAAGNRIQLEPLGAHLLRGVREPKEIFRFAVLERCLGGKVTRTWRVITTRRRFLGLAVGLLLACTGWSLRAQSPEETSAARLMDDLMWNRGPIGGPFALIKLRTDEDFRGKLLLIYFGYSYCPDVCPTNLQQIGLAVDGLGAGADAVQQLFITLDPERDTAVHLNASKEKGRREKTPSCLPRGPRTHSRPIDGRPLGVSAQ